MVSAYVSEIQEYDSSYKIWVQFSLGGQTLQISNIYSSNLCVVHMKVKVYYMLVLLNNIRAIDHGCPPVGRDNSRALASGLSTYRRTNNALSYL